MYKLWMVRISGYLTFLLTIIIGCKSGQEDNATTATDANTVYYPINNYIRRQIKEVDTVPYFLYQLSIVNGKRDSTVVRRSLFDSAAQLCLLPQLEETTMRTNFAESVFEDETTDSYTLSYVPLNKNNVVQNASVLLDRNNQKIKWIFINTIQNAGDSTVVQKIGWKGGESCYINRAVSHATGQQSTRQLIFVWNEK